MIKRFEIVQDEDSRVSLQCVESFDISTGDDLSVYDILYIVKECFSLDILNNEHVYIVSTDYRGKIIGVFLVSIGDYKGCNVYNRSIGIFLLLIGTKKFLMVHNHPDNQVYASVDDITNSIELDGLGKLLGLQFVGSYIIGRDGWCKVNNGNEEIEEWEDYE